MESCKPACIEHPKTQRAVQIFHNGRQVKLLMKIANELCKTMVMTGLQLRPAGSKTGGITAKEI